MPGHTPGATRGPSRPCSLHPLPGIQARGEMTTTTEAAIGSSVRDCCPITAFRPTDHRLAALLESKPAADDVPLEAWWHLAESLQHSVAVRRAREGVATLDAAALRQQTYQARWSAQAA